MRYGSIAVIILLLSNAFAPVLHIAMVPTAAGPLAPASRDTAGPFGPADLVKQFDTGIIDGDLGPEVVIDDLNGDGHMDMLYYYDLGGSGGMFVNSAIDLVTHKYLWTSNWTADSPRNWTKVVDLDGDGNKELLWVTNTNVYVVHANNGTFAWTANTGDIGGCTYGDVDGDKRMEIIVSTDGMNVQYKALNGTTGALKWTSGLLGHTYNPRVADVDSDGHGELIVEVKNVVDYGVTVIDAVSNTTEWSKTFTNPISVVVGDFNGTGKNGVLVRDSVIVGGYLAGPPSPVPTNLTLFWKGGVQVWKKNTFQSMAFISQMVNTDGDKDLEALSSDHVRGDIELIDAGNGTSQGYYYCATYPPVWSKPLNDGAAGGSDIVSMGHGMGDYGLALFNGTGLGFMHRFNFSTAPSALQDDVDGDSVLEFIARPQSDSIHVFNGTSYGLEWKNTSLGTGTILTDGWLMGWFNGSSKVKDILTTSYNGGAGANVVFFSGINGSTTESTGQYLLPRIFVKDVDGDGLDELILMSDDTMGAQSHVYLLKADFPPRLRGTVSKITFLEDGNVTHAVDISKHFFDDGLNGPLTYGVVTGPGQMPVLGSLDGTWLNVKSNISDWNGNTTVDVTATDGKHSPTVLHIPVEVLSVNDLPVIQPVGDQSFLEHSRARFTVNASDVDDPVLSFTDNTSLFDIDSSTGQIDFTPGEAEVGSWFVNVTVTDHLGAMAWVHFKVTIVNVNDPPVISTLDVTTATEWKEYRIKYNATDPDKGDTVLTWSLRTAGHWLTIDPSTGVLNGTPGEADIGHGYVNVTVSDPHGANASHNFTLNVININEPPVWKNVPKDAIMKDTDKYSFDVNATDQDLADRITYGVRVTPSLKVSIDTVTGVLSCTPDPGTSGNYTLNISATDGTWTIYHSFKIQVTHIIVPVDQPPTATLKAPADGSEVALLNPTLEWAVYDAESEAVTSDLYLGKDRNQVLGNNPSALLATATSAHSFKITTPLEKGTTYYWTVVPKDPSAVGSCPSGVWSFKVKADAVVNQPPVLTPITTKQEATAGQTFKLQVQGSDPDPGDASKLTYSLSGQPNGMIIDPSKGLIYYVPTEAQAGNYTVKVTLSDGKESVNMTFQLEVKKATVNPPNPHHDNGLSNLMIGLIVAVIAVVAAAIVGFAVWSRRKRKEYPFPVEQQAKASTEPKVEPKPATPPPAEEKKGPEPKAPEPAKETKPEKPATEEKPKAGEKKEQDDELDKILAGIDDEAPPKPKEPATPSEPELSKTVERPFTDDSHNRVH